MTATTLVGALHDCANRWPDRPVVFPELGEKVTVRRLLEHATDFAARVAEAGVRRGHVVGLLSATGPQVLVGLFGVTFTGAAVSLLPTPPMMRDLDSAARHVISFLDAAEIRYLLVDDSQKDLGDLVRAARPGLTVLRLPDGVALFSRPPSPEADATGVDQPALPEVLPDDIAVIQYTSGSTSDPKGVVLRHRTVLAGLRSIGVSAEVSPDDVFIQWVPHFHDMGLFGWLAYLLHGATTHTFSPGGFIRRPAGFLRYFAEHRGTVTCGPDFGYDLILATVDDQTVRELDLSSWRFAFNGSEPVSAATVEAFCRRLAPAGFRASAMFPVYGMAEATLAVTFPAPDEAPHVLHVDRRLLVDAGEVRLVDATDPEAKPVVAVGRPVDGMQLRLVTSAGDPAPDGELAEVRIRGEAVTEAYYRAPKATRSLFEGGWLRTGDLAFRHEDRLYVAGRLKDMVIVGGRNFFAQDVEAVVRDVPGVFRRRCVAVPEEAEYLTVVAETKEHHEQLAERIRARIATELGLSAIRVHLVRPGQLPRTTSGKWQRGKAARMAVTAG
ncbi:AMP-binding protein [Streptomyces sp. NPDC005708]|uniref:AMP-binding protein n=1 Tax=unclassified Streptomyces TaxID=2593676 RepID=UPI0033D42AF6